MSLVLKSVLNPSVPAIVGSIFGRIGSVWGGLPDLGTLLAAPKKRTSHQKKRQRQLAGNNQQRPLRNIGRCPACGHYKRAHTLCMNCVKEIQALWRSKGPKQPPQHELDPKDEQFTYPKRLTRPSEYDERLARREHILSRPRTLPAKAKK